jgi:hypothetical protein
MDYFKSIVTITDDDFLFPAYELKFLLNLRNWQYKHHVYFVYWYNKYIISVKKKLKFKPLLLTVVV